MPGATLCRVRSSSGSLIPPRRLLMGSGPSNSEPRVLQAMIAAPIAPDDPAFAGLLDDVMHLGRTVFRTNNRCTLFCPGASRAGLEAVVASLLEPADRCFGGPLQPLRRAPVQAAETLRRQAGAYRRRVGGACRVGSNARENSS